MGRGAVRLPADIAKRGDCDLLTPMSESLGATGVAARDPRKFCLFDPLWRSPRCAISASSSPGADFGAHAD